MENLYDFGSNLKYLNLLSKTYKNILEVSEEIINLQAILNLPKGTELFLSDIHGEYESFLHILNNASGVIRIHIDELYSNSINGKERKTLATLIYYPEEKLELIKKEEIDLNEWYRIYLYRLIEVCKVIGSKYTRSKVRKALPKGFDYIIDQLLNMQGDAKNKDQYYNQIIKTIIEIDRADEFIIAISNLIRRLAVDHLHVIGDIYDRGTAPEKILDFLQKFHSVDIQWGNHDILWMGAACGSAACIANVLRICSRYDNLDTIEEGYGINIRPLSLFAMKKYQNDDCLKFMPKLIDPNKYSNSDKIIVSKIHKAISVIQFKIEGQVIKKHPEYSMEDRLILDKIDYKAGTININNKIYELNDKNFPTINPDNPYELSNEENELVERLIESFLRSEKLQDHITFLYSKGGIYNRFNSNLLFHGCVPLTEDGEFKQVNILDKNLSGKEYFDYLDRIVRKIYFDKLERVSKKDAIDIFWFLWCAPDSPVFGKDKAATFERYFINDKETHEEKKNPYYKLMEEEENCDKILKEFNLDPEISHIINGHMPVKRAKGESPARANGKLLVIDGGLAKSYREQTGIAGYTLVYNSYGLVLIENQPFESKAKAVEYGIDINSKIVIKENVGRRKMVADTDIGKKLKSEVEDLKMLLAAYREGIIKEKLI